MSIDVLEHPTRLADPLDVLEAVAAHAEMDAERVDRSELHINVAGSWRDLAVWFAWRPDLNTLQLGAPLELKVPDGKLADACRLLALVNERVWIGHFDLWSDDNGIVYRHGLVLSDGTDIDKVQAECLIRGAAEAFDRFFPAFNFLIWGGKSPEEALEASLFETVGNA